MPVYLYQCEACGVRFEKFQRMSDDPLADCPECDGHVHRVIQPVGVIFKGSGFYVTDNRRSSSSTLAAPKDEDGEQRAGEASSEEASVAEGGDSSSDQAEDTS
jgi:putative FmdB family regulatory protein